MREQMPKFEKGICWFCQNTCDISSYTHKECIMNYFYKPKHHHVIQS